MDKKESDLALCHFCDETVNTYIIPETTYVTIIVICLVILIFGIWSVCLLPFAIPLSKAMVTRCRKCQGKLKVRQPYGLSGLKDEVLSFKCGQCAIVFSRSYLVSILTVIIFIIILFWGTDEHIKSYEYSSASWHEYVHDCGSEVLLQNSVKAHDTFARKYLGKTISWEGYLVKATENQGSWFRGDHAVILLVKMIPSESDIHADLILSMDDHDFQKNIQALSSLDKGSEFRFNATFISVGDENSLHHLHADSIEKLSGFMAIPAHLHNVNQRYTPKTPSVQIVNIENVKPEIKHNDTHTYSDSDQENPHA
ncbi:unnamed protein product [Blepharisma stoltei]|uniref:LITAF domain-containing protein n=1 Tax=Blepharisma stoltei TaxID=1481888 RepID=A0AAU9I9K3_9CILI|nr:unnamed protein product [Blepharisma stoltei]